MPRILNYIEPITGDQTTLRLEDGDELVQVLNVRRIGPDFQWSIVVSREVADEPEDDNA